MSTRKWVSWVDSLVLVLVIVFLITVPIFLVGAARGDFWLHWAWNIGSSSLISAVVFFLMARLFSSSAIREEEFEEAFGFPPKPKPKSEAGWAIRRGQIERVIRQTAEQIESDRHMLTDLQRFEIGLSPLMEKCILAVTMGLLVEQEEKLQRLKELAAEELQFVTPATEPEGKQNPSAQTPTG